LDQSRKFIYGAATSVGVAGFAIDAATGNLRAVPGSPFAAGGNTFSVTTTMGH
jgi:hypothetical protein